MDTTFIEATQGVTDGFNHGKFMLARFTADEWDTVSALGLKQHTRVSLIGSQGWSRDHTLVLDLATGEGAIFRLGGSAHNDLEKHRVWVCPMFEPFLEWLYQQDTDDLGKLPPLVELPNVEASFYGHRRPGPAA